MQCSKRLSSVHRAQNLQVIFLALHFIWKKLVKMLVVCVGSASTYFMLLKLYCIDKVNLLPVQSLFELITC